MNAGSRIAIEIRGQGGAATVIVNARQWFAMSAASCVLAIHNAARDVTQGQPFDTVRERMLP